MALDEQGFLVIGTYNDYCPGFVSHNPIGHEDGTVLEHMGLVVVGSATVEELIGQYNRFFEPHIGPYTTDPSRWKAIWMVVAE
jgi:hypothetical protein